MTGFPALSTVLSQLEPLLVWGLVATILLTIILYGSQGLGLSRMSLPFLIGTCMTAQRGRAVAYGLVIYLLGGWLFAFLYAWIFVLVGVATWWLGAILGLLHAVFLLVAVLPVAPYLHPRIVSPYSGPTTRRRLEPPGFMGLNYGRRTPLTTILAHALYGAVIGAAFAIPG